MVRMMRTSPEGIRIWALSPVLGHQLGIGAGGAHQLGALAGVHLHVVDHGTHGMLAMGRQLPGLISAEAEESTLSPAVRPTGAMM